MGEYLPGIVWLVVLLAGNAFFVGAEFAVISARRCQIEPRAAEGSRAARTTLWAMEHATLMLATSQLGITVCSLLILTVSEPAIHHLLEYPLGITPLSPEAISVAGLRRRAAAGHLPARRASARWCPRTSRSRCPTGPRSLLAPAAGAGLAGPAPGDRHAELDRQRGAPALPGRAQGRGEQHLHPRGGGRHRGAVTPRGHPGRRLGHAGRRLRVHRPVRGRRGGGRCATWCCCPRRRPRPTCSRRSTTTATRATSSPTTPGAPRATCTSRT